MAVRGKSLSMTRKRKKTPHTEFHTVKRIDNSRLVRHAEPARMQGFYRTAGWGAVIAVFLMFYVYQHFRCIDLSFQLEDMRARQTKMSALNSELRLEIEGLRDPRRIDVIARRQLGLTEPLPTQVQEYDAPAGAEVAAVRYLHANRAQ
jgi:cell division protein FtsB